MKRSVVLSAAIAVMIAGCGGSDGGGDGRTSSGTTAGTETSPAPTAERLSTEAFATLVADRSKLGGTTKACSGTSFAAAGDCVARQFVPLLTTVTTYLGNLGTARRTVAGACAAALDNSITFQRAQAARMRRIIAQGRKVETKAQFATLNALLTANGKAATANDAARAKAPESDWAVACKPGA